jgi:hypothetical protein
MAERENRPEPPPQEPKKKHDSSLGLIYGGATLLFAGGVELAASQLGFHVDTRAGVIFTSSLLGAGAGLTFTGIIFRATKR